MGWDEMMSLGMVALAMVRGIDVTALRLSWFHHLFACFVLFAFWHVWDGSDCRVWIYVAFGCSMVATVFPSIELDF